MVYKHAISTVVPARNVKMPGPGEEDVAEEKPARKFGVDSLKARDEEE